MPRKTTSTFLKKLVNRSIWKRIYYERLTEPLHLNIISLFVALFGGFRAKVAHDLVLRHHHAYSILNCADLAIALGIREVTLVEFGVAAGAGLLNICSICEAVTRETGVKFRVFGFDTGRGMPPPLSYKDHPELYQEGDFPMNCEALKNSLPLFARFVIGNVSDTVGPFLREIDSAAPIGFVSLDIDYYSSAKEALRVLQGRPEQYLPRTIVYLDDLEDQSHNTYCGELLAVKKFNQENELRKIERHRFLRGYRLFKNARWIDHIFTCHVLDHPARQPGVASRPQTVLSNPYL